MSLFPLVSCGIGKNIGLRVKKLVFRQQLCPCSAVSLATSSPSLSFSISKMVWLDWITLQLFHLRDPMVLCRSFLWALYIPSLSVSPRISLFYISVVKYPKHQIIRQISLVLIPLPHPTRSFSRRGA